MIISNSLNTPLWVMPNNIKNGACLKLNEALFDALIHSGDIVNHFILPGIEKDNLDKDFGVFDSQTGRLVKSTDDFKPDKTDAYFDPKKIAKSFTLDEMKLIKAIEECGVKSIEIKGVRFYSFVEFHTKNTLDKYQESNN